MKRLLLIALLAAACGDDDDGSVPDAPVATPDARAVDGPLPDALIPIPLPYPTLAQYGFFEGNGATQTPVAGVVPFTVISPLFADFTDKHRFIQLPPGGKITYSATGTWDLPVGSFVIKTFAVGPRLIETRVFIHKAEGWLPTTYLWNEAQTEATLHLVGARVNVVVKNEAGADVPLEYRVPNQNQCYGCHGLPGVANLLGVRTRQLNRDLDFGGTVGVKNQIAHLDSLGAFAAPLPPANERAALADPYAAGGDLDAKARSWLEANCAHCHSPGGAAGGTHLWLNVDVTVPIDYGVCRIPNAAGPGAGGRPVDIMPGEPENSIMTFRIASSVPGIKMPEMPIQLVDQRGLDLITAWIEAMPGSCSSQ